MIFCSLKKMFLSNTPTSQKKYGKKINNLFFYFRYIYFVPPPLPPHTHTQTQNTPPPPKEKYNSIFNDRLSYAFFFTGKDTLAKQRDQAFWLCVL